MTLHGRFNDGTGRPQLDGHLQILDLEIGGPISFLVDTGADYTLLMPKDAERLGLDYSLLDQETPVHGVGGTAMCYVERAVVMFNDDNEGLIAYLIQIRIMRPGQSSYVAGLPSLLGRDILRHWRMDFWPINQSLTFEVMDTDG